jgi:inosine triphosphate pyrophosphatase
MLRTLKLISSNEGKLREMKHFLGPELEKIGVGLEMMPIELTEIQGTAEEVIRDKIVRAGQATSYAVICEDTCLCFSAWQGLPGPYM